MAFVVAVNLPANAEKRLGAAKPDIAA